MKYSKPPENATDLAVRAIEDLKLDSNAAKKVLYATRTLCKELGYPQPEKCPITTLPRSEAELKAVPRTAKGIQVDSSYRSYLTHAMKVIRYGLEKGWIKAGGNPGEDFGIPSLLRQEMTPQWSRTLWVWMRLISFATARKRTFEGWDLDFILDFYSTILSEPRENARVDLRWFVKTMRGEIEAGRFPAFPLPDLPTKKKETYRIKLNALPLQFHDGADGMKSWLLDEVHEERGRASKVAESTANLVLGIMERYLGFLYNIKGVDLRNYSWDTVIRREWVYEWILFTDDGALEKAADGKIPTGVTQADYLYHVEKMAAGPLGLPNVAEEISSLRDCFHFERKREGPPEWLTPNHLFQCALWLIEEAAKARAKGHLTRAATYIRDALFFALLGVFPRRYSTFGMLTETDHLKMFENRLPQIMLPLEETKTKERDSLFEVPREILSLLLCYIYIDRLQLLGDNEDEGHLFIAEGGHGMDKKSLRAVFRRRMIQFIGFDGGPHSTRMTWTWRFLNWRDGGYLLAMVILDTWKKRIEEYYRDAQERIRAQKFTSYADAEWNRIANNRSTEDE